MSPAIEPAEVAVLAALAGAPAGLSPGDLVGHLGRADVAASDALAACEALLVAEQIALRGGAFELTGGGATALLAAYAAIANALDPSPSTPGMEECASIPWLTTVQTHWLDAVSINYAVAPDALAPLLPAPLEPEVHRGVAWVQVLLSSLREMRPQGAPALFGVNFHQVSYRAAVSYRGGDGRPRRGGYFIRSETDHGVMRAVGNALREFRFHDFGLAEIRTARAGTSLSVAVAPGAAWPHGRIDAAFDTRAGQGAPRGSVWRSTAELHEPLVECYDAFGVDPDGWLYVLTIDREPWAERFVTPTSLRCEYFETGPLGGGAARFDSALHVPQPCGYRWRPLRRERWR